MKQVIYRILAAAIVIAAGYTAFLTAADSDFRAELPFGTVSAVIGFLLIIPTFTAYALAGEKAGNPVLVLLSKLIQLPDTLLGRIAQRYVELPAEFQQRRSEADKPSVPSASSAPAEPIAGPLEEPRGKP